MLLLSWNVNGIRSVLGKGFIELLQSWKADIVCLQETKAKAEQISLDWSQLGYFAYWSEAQKAGYSGVLTLTKKKPREIWNLGITDFDQEGRVIGLDYDGFTVMNTYFPNSQEAGARLDYKLAFCQALEEKVQNTLKYQKNIAICGDFNIAHQPIDLTNPKQNEKNPGYLPEERAWMTHFLGKGWIDSFRALYPEQVKYSWWSYRFNARQKNIGWRIDYFVISPAMRSFVTQADIWDHVYGSDHCPVVLNLTSDWN